MSTTGSESVRFPAETTAALLAAFLSHPLERTATMAQKLNSNITVSYCYIIENQGYGGFLKGVFWRSGLVATAIVVMNNAKNLYEFFLEKSLKHTAFNKTKNEKFNKIAKCSQEVLPDTNSGNSFDRDTNPTNLPGLRK